ncbi:MAG TPA: MBG domain-containing protein, partial [Chitinophagaceae bacterium]
MRLTLPALHKSSLLLLALAFSSYFSNAQQALREYVIFGNAGVQVGTSNQIVSGKTGSNVLVQSTGTASFGGDIHSKGRVLLANTNTVNGNVTAANATTPAASGTIFQMGSNAVLAGTGGINGNVVIQGGNIGGPVVYSGTYSGPEPTNGKTQGDPILPVLPPLPPEITPNHTGGANITGTQTINPGSWGAINLSGGQTVTFNTPGIYIFSSIRNSGNFNKFVFNFPRTDGRYRIYVVGDVDLYKINISQTGQIPGLPNPSNLELASRIFMQVSGTGSTSPSGSDAWIIANGASGNNQSIWIGTVYAPNGNISVGSGSSESKIIGALWSGKNVNIQSGVSVTYAAFEDCSPTADAGPDKDINCDFPSAVLTGTSNASNAQFSWTKLNGTIPGVTNTASITVTQPGTYVLSVQTPECTIPATDTVVVTSTPCVLPFYPPPSIGKVDKKIGAELNSLYENYGNVLDDGKTLFILVNGKVLIDVIVKAGNFATVKSLLEGTSYGLTNQISNGQNSLIITGLYPISNLAKFDEEPMKSLVSFCRPSYPPVNNSGLIQSQGDSAMRTNFVRNGFNLTGDSVKVGVLSDSYNTKPNNDVDNGDLPGLPGDTVQVLMEYPYGQRSDEGRAMLQIVHDVAPKAKLAFRTGFLTAGDMGEGIRQLADSLCDVIVDDITFITEPFFKPGVIANAVRDVSLRGVHYVTAAGNFGNKSYEAIFNPSTAILPFGIPGRAHDFGGGDIYQSDSVKGSATQPGIYTVVLQWEDDIYSLGGNPGASADLDAYAFDNMGNLIGFNRVNIDGDPTEVLTFVVTRNTIVNIMIVDASNTTIPIRFKYIGFRGDLKINDYPQGSSTIVGQGNAPEAITVGASLYLNTPAFGVNNITRSTFSSIGGTSYLGAASQKPDIMAPNGINTSVDFGGPNWDFDNDGVPNFFGTSAAAPHVAAAVALLIEGRRKYYRDTLAPAQIKSFLTTNAIDMDVPGFDLNTGFGFIQVDSAVRSMANPTPQITGLRLVDSSIVLGSATSEVIVSGSYLTGDTKVLLGTDTLESAILNSSELSATIPVFSGEQSLYLYTTPKSPLLSDGGLSDPRVLNGVVKKVVTVVADNKTRKYGETNPEFTATILVDNQPTTLTLAELGLTSLSFSTQATPSSNVGIYFIRPVRVFDSTGVDQSLLQLYHFILTDGILTVQKLPLTISPVDQTITYGDALTNVTFNYQFNQSNIANVSAILDTIKLYHDTHTPDNALAVIKDFNAIQADGQTLSSSDIANMNMIITFNALKNSRKFDVVNNKLVPATTLNSLNGYYIVDVASQSLYNFTKDAVNSVFINASAGLTSKTMVGYNALTQGIANVTSDNQPYLFVNGSFIPMYTSGGDSKAPIINGQLVQLVSGQLVQLVSGEPVPVPNASLVQLVSGQLVQLVSGVPEPIPNGQLVQLVSGQLVQMVSGQLVQLVSGQLVQLVSGQLVQLVSGQLVQMVSGVPQPIPNGQLVQLVSGQLVQMVSGSLGPIPNGQLVQMVSSSVVQFVNSQLVQLVNANAISGTNSKTAVIADEDDVNLQNGWLGAMHGINMITGLGVGQQKLIPGIFINENFDVTYQAGNVTINGKPLTIKAKDSVKVYGESISFAGTEFSVVSGSLQDGESIASVTLGSTGAAATANKGVYPINVSNATGAVGTDMANYSITYISGLLSVNERPLTVTADAKSKLYGNGDPVFTYQVTTGSVANNDAFSGALSRTAGENVGAYSINRGTLSLGSNYAISYTGANLTITKAPLTVIADNKTKVYGDANPALTASYSGLKFGQNFASSGITGSPVLNTTATVSSIPGSYPISVETGTLSSSNYDFTTFTPGTLTINDNTSCLLTHSRFTNFGSTPPGATSLWLNIEIKVSGQLNTAGDYIMFSGGTINFNNIISSPSVQNAPVKRGMITAANVPSPVTYFDASLDMFVTKVPVGFSSTSDIFISGAIINSSNGFTSKNGSSSTLKGIFYTNKSFSDQWNYAMAAYQKPGGVYVSYTDLTDPAGTIVSTNGSYKA